MAERARCDHHVGAGVLRLFQIRPVHGQGDVLFLEDDRKAAAFDFSGILHGLRSHCPYQRFHRRRMFGIIKSYIPGWSKNVAPIKGRDMEVAERNLYFILQSLHSDFAHDDPQQMFDLHHAAVDQTFGCQQPIHACEKSRIAFEPSVGAAHDSLTGPADRHDVETQPFRLGECACAERERSFRVCLPHHSGTTAGGCGQFRDFNPKPSDDRHRGLKQLWRGSFGGAAWIERVLHTGPPRVGRVRMRRTCSTP